LYLIETFFAMKIDKVPVHGDPSEVIQQFVNMNIKVLCCRFWWLREWESHNMSFPYWRLYWNSKPGAFVKFGTKVMPLGPENIIIIPPHTAFSTTIDGHFKTTYSLDGGLVDNLEQYLAIQNENICHLFIHFKLGFLFDHIKPNVFSFPLDGYSAGIKESVLSYFMSEHRNFDMQISIKLHTLISHYISLLPPESFDDGTKDLRIIRVLAEINQNIKAPHKNDDLAREVFLATNSFIRLFKAELGETPQNYVLRKKIEFACVQLHHTTLSIDDIAESVGFKNRYHFSRIFKAVTATSPAAFRKKWYNMPK